MDQKIEPSLNTDERGIYEACLISSDSDTIYLPCVITGKFKLVPIISIFDHFKFKGYPVLKKIEFKNNLAANIDDWNTYLMNSKVILFS